MSTEDHHSDIIIIGGGLAGLTAAQYASRAGLTVDLFEGMAPGGQALVIDSLENYPGFDEPISGFELAERFTRQAEKFGATIHYASVDAVTQNADSSFFVSTDDGNFITSVVIIATGAKHRHLGVPGEEEYQGKGVSYCATCDGPFFKGKRMFVIGGGDSACDEALFLAKLSSDIVIVHRKGRFRAQKGIADMVERNKHIEKRFFHTVKAIEGDGTKVTGIILHDIEHECDYRESCDAVFIFIGSDPNISLVPFAQVSESGYLVTDSRMRTSVNGLFAIGDVRETPFRQIVTAASDGAIAAHTASQYIDAIRGQAYR